MVYSLKTMTDIKTNPIEYFYDNRRDFTIVGLTGLTGAGCSYLAKIMSEKEFLCNSDYNIRKPESILVKTPEIVENPQIYANDAVDESNEAVSRLVFKRKYTICHNFISKQYEPYLVIKYTRVIWLFTFLYVISEIEKSGNGSDIEKITSLKKKIIEILQDKYCPSHKPLNDIQYRKHMEYREKEKKETYRSFFLHLKPVEDWILLYEELKDDELLNLIPELNNHPSKGLDKLANIFFDKSSAFNQFCDYFNSELSRLDYYCFCFFYHRMGAVIRNMGNPTEKSEDSYENLGNDNSHVYDLVQLINLIIKGARKKSEDRSCRVVIDSIRTSLEATFLRERFSAFYLIAVNDDQRQKHLKEKIAFNISSDLTKQSEEATFIDLLYERTENLCKIEAKGKHFEQGKFASPNLEQCIADAEIHISNPEVNEVESPSLFYSLGEQWMKYASLILHPGLITPSSEERCMVVAYTAKFNSGCLSRQVGAVITNKYHAIRTIGWNDVPYGQIPCSLRELSDLTAKESERKSYYKYMYSEYERTDSKTYFGAQSLRQKICEDYPALKESEKELLGLPYSYCFKTLHNRYEGEKNQVYTRSLHAEENAMMQMVKFGGEKLIDGIIYVTASPCELCSKKLYQIGVRKIVYIDPYPGIARQQIIHNGFKRPALKLFQGAYGSTYNKLYQPFISYKDELAIRTQNFPRGYISSDSLLTKILDKLGLDYKRNYKKEEIEDILSKIKSEELKQENKVEDSITKEIATVNAPVKESIEDNNEENKSQPPK